MKSGGTILLSVGSRWSLSTAEEDHLHHDYDRQQFNRPGAELAAVDYVPVHPLRVRLFWGISSSRWLFGTFAEFS